MRKFKHKKTGYIATQLNCENGRTDLFKYDCGTPIKYSLPLSLLENSCDWEEVVEKDYEILEVRSKYRAIYSYIEKLDYDLKDKTIFKIKRKSDGEIFTVGDDVISKTCAVPNKILSIELINNKIRLYPRNSYYNLEDVRKAKQKLFTTEDGVDIYEGDTVWHVNLNTNMKPYSSIVKYTEPFTPVRGLFSTKEKAEEWIILNKPCLSINDIKNVGNGRTAYNIVAGSLIELVKSKL